MTTLLTIDDKTGEVLHMPTTVEFRNENAQTIDRHRQKVYLGQFGFDLGMECDKQPVFLHHQHNPFPALLNEQVQHPQATSCWFRILFQSIQRQAFRLWQAAGSPPGHDGVSFWLQAESMILPANQTLGTLFPDHPLQGDCHAT